MAGCSMRAGGSWLLNAGEPLDTSVQAFCFGAPALKPTR